ALLCLVARLTANARSEVANGKIRPLWLFRYSLSLLLTEPLEQRRDVHLVGLVVAGQRVHHDVHAGAERELALPWLAADDWQHGLAVRPDRPGAGQVVRGDDDG